MAASGKKVFFAIPVYGSVPSQFMSCFGDLTHNPPCPNRISVVSNDSLVTRARNTLSAKFLASDCTHMMFIDSDIEFTREQMARMVSHDLDLVGGLYPLKRQHEMRWCMTGLPGKVADADGLMEVRHVGTGFMLIARSVFEDMIAADGPEIVYRSDFSKLPEHDFWRVGVHEQDGVRRYLSEDWYFCHRWAQLGGKIHADTKVRLRHVGQAVYPLDSQRALAEAPPPSG